MDSQKANRRPVVEVVDDDTARILRTKTGAERLKIASDMFSTVREMILSYLRAKHPEWEEWQFMREAARRISRGASDVIPESFWKKKYAR